jgi:probable rRNA maturation factor
MTSGRDDPDSSSRLDRPVSKAGPDRERRGRVRPRGTARVRVSVCDGLGRPVQARGLTTWLAGIAPARARGEITVALVSDAKMRTLNREHRRVDRATDVLSFPSASGSPTDVTSNGVRRAGAGRPSGLPTPLGDIVIATGVARRQARERGHSVDHELRVLALHGLLHLLGYDHEHDAGAMARVERRLRRRGGLTEGLIERGVEA